MLTNEHSQIRPLLIMGPTASGKTATAVRLAQILDGEVISVDSALVYRGLDIGSAKPTKVEMCSVPHALIDIRDPDEPYSAADFCRDANREIERILSAGKVPILAGGTMLYFKALLEGLSKMPEVSAETRAQIELEARQKGWPAMHEQLAQIDPSAAEKIHPNHSQRICRALEVWRSSGRPMSAWQAEAGCGLRDRIDCVQVALYPSDRQSLHKRIEQRFLRMVEEGFVEEVRELHAQPQLHKDLPAIRAVGYRQVWEYLDGDYGYDIMQQKALAATRQLAKRQLTWLRSWPELQKVDLSAEPNKLKDLGQIVQELLSIYGKSTI